jgi:S-adenosylmethionine decarboxylase
LNTIGYHYIVEAAGCDPAVLGSPDRMRDLLVQAAKVADMGIRTSYFYRFSPSGVSGVVIISESLPWMCFCVEKRANQRQPSASS